MTKRLWILTAAAATALLLPSAALAGMTDPDWKGFFVELDGALVTPGNTNTPLIAGSPADGAASGGTTDLQNEIEWMDWKDSLSGKIGLGYQWGKKGRLQVTYWSYSDESSKSGRPGSYDAYSNPTGTNYNWFTVGPTASWGYSFYETVAFNFNQEIKASALDVEFKRAVVMNSPMTVTWGIGLRFLDFKDTVEGVYTLDNVAGFIQFPARRKVEGDGFGFSGSVGAEYGFNDRLGLATNLRVGFVNSNVDSEHAVVDQDGYYSSAGVEWSEATTREDELATTIDFDAGLALHLGKHLDLDLGWTYTTWSDLPQFNLGRATMGTDDQGGIPEIRGEERDKIVWSGPRIAGRWRF